MVLREKLVVVSYAIVERNDEGEFPVDQISEDDLVTFAKLTKDVNLTEAMKIAGELCKRLRPLGHPTALEIAKRHPNLIEEPRVIDDSEWINI